MVRRAVDQVERRVVRDNPAPSNEKLVSLFEPHVQVIPRFKPARPGEFGCEVGFNEFEGGIITDYRVLERGDGQD